MTAADGKMEPIKSLPEVPAFDRVLAWRMAAERDIQMLEVLVAILNCQKEQAWNVRCEEEALWLTRRYVLADADQCELYNDCVIGDGDFRREEDGGFTATVNVTAADLLERRIWVELTGRSRPLD